MWHREQGRTEELMKILEGGDPNVDAEASRACAMQRNYKEKIANHLLEEVNISPDEIYKQSRYSMTTTRAIDIVESMKET